jgi:hemerythrin-like metal-binding protein
MAKKFIWTKEYSVNVQEIDEQHQEFFSIVNSILEAAENEATTKETLITDLGKLGDYAFYHLSTEEELFKKFNYPQAEEHVQIHKMFREKAQALIDAAVKGELNTKDIVKEAAEFAGDWLQKHIMVMDKQYTEFFNANGLK